MAQAIVKLLATDALPALQNTMIMGNLVNRDYENVLAASGDTVNVPIPGTAVANNISETGTVQSQNQGLGNAQIVLNMHVESSFTIPDVTKAIAHPALLMAYMQPAINAVGERMESDILSMYINFTANASLGTGGSGLASESTIDLAETALFNAKVGGAQKFLVCGAGAYSDVRQLPRFTEMQTSGDGAAIASGVVGQLKGFKVYRHTLAPKVGSTTYNLAFVRDAITVATRPLAQPLQGTGAIATYVDHNGFGLRILTSYNPSTLSQSYTVDSFYGVAVLRNQFGLQVLS